MAARNGSGTYTRSYDFTADRDAGPPTNAIDADRVDEELDGIATALTASIAKDGQTTPTANLPMGGFSHTSVATAAPSSRAVYASVAALQDNGPLFIAAGGTADALTATFAPALTALTNGCEVCVRALTANATTTPTFAPNGLTAKTIVKGANIALVAGDIAGQHHELRLRYNSTTDKWHLLNPTIAPASGTTVINNGGTLEVALPRNAQTGTTYTYLTGDRGKHVTHSNGSAIAGTLPQAGSAGFTNSWFAYVENISTGLLTITPTTSTINGAATLVLQNGQGALITSDGTNYRALLCGFPAVAETAVIIGTDQFFMRDASTASLKYSTAQILFDALFTLTAKTTPVTADTFPMNDTAASNVAKNVTFGNLKAAMAAAASDQETASSTALFVTPGVQQRHPSAAKFWAKVAVNATLTVGYNVASIDDGGTGIYTINYTTAFSGADYATVGAVVTTSAGLGRMAVFRSPATGSVIVEIINDAGSNSETSTSHVCASGFGDQ